MGLIAPVFDGFNGMQLDPPLDDMPHNVMRRIVNLLPFPHHAAGQRRGRWEYLTGAVTHTGGRFFTWATYCPFGSSKRIVLSGDQDLSYVTDLDGSTTGTSISTTVPNAPAGMPLFHLTAAGGLLILPRTGAANIMQKYEPAGGLATLGGTPPKAIIVASWGDYLLLADDATNRNRLWFSAPGNPESWNITTGYIDFPEKIEAVVPKGNMIFVFSDSNCHLLLGDTPPPGGNMTLKKFQFNQGCQSPEHVTTYKDFVIWANSNGVWKSDGGQPVNLLSQGGIQTYWPAVYVPSAGDLLSVGVFRNYLFVTDTLSDKSHWRTIIYDLEKNTWWEWSNLRSQQYSRLPFVSGKWDEDMIFVDSANHKIVGVEPCFGYGGGTSVDPDNLGITPEVQTGYYRFGSLGQKRLRRAYVSSALKSGSNLQAYYQLPDRFPGPAVAAPQLSIGANLLGISIASTFDNYNLRVPFRIDRKAEMIGFYFTGGGPDWRLSGLDVEVDVYGKSRAGDLRA